jgi:hypothetical protein
MTTEILLGAIIIPISLYAVELFRLRRDSNKAANREIYQQLEMASINLFQFEADHLDIIRPVWEEGVALPPEGSAERVAVTDYVCQILNLFEMAIRFRMENVMPPSVFGSWVIWYYALGNTPHFPEIWQECRLDYAPDLRQIMNKAVELSSEEPDEDKRRRLFFDFVSEVSHCEDVKHWLDEVHSESTPLSA